jgi:uncharacterized protein YndB with AHSA1/START domain
MMIAMKLRHENVYDAPAAAVFAMLVDPAYRQKVAAATDAISCNAAFGGGKLVVREEQAVKGVPGFAKKFVGDSTLAIHTEVWDDAGTSATFEVETPGKPTHITGTITLSDSGGRTTHVYDLEVKASVPLVGGKLEKLVAGLTADGFDKEHAVGVAWLTGER